MMSTGEERSSLLICGPVDLALTKSVEYLDGLVSVFLYIKLEPAVDIDNEDDRDDEDCGGTGCRDLDGGGNDGCL